MRCSDGGGLSAAQRARREVVLLQAAAMFEQGVSPVQVARELRVSTKSAYQRRRRRQLAAMPRYPRAVRAVQCAG